MTYQTNPLYIFNISESQRTIVNNMTVNKC